MFCLVVGLALRFWWWFCGLWVVFNGGFVYCLICCGFRAVGVGLFAIVVCLFGVCLIVLIIVLWYLLCCVVGLG